MSKVRSTPFELLIPSRVKRGDKKKKKSQNADLEGMEGWHSGWRRENMRSHSFVSCDNKRQSTKAQMNVSSNIYTFFFQKRPSGSPALSAPPVGLSGEAVRSCVVGASDAAMAVPKAASHPVNISEQKNRTAERTLNCFPLLSPRDSILLF